MSQTPKFDFDKWVETTGGIQLSVDSPILPPVHDEGGKEIVSKHSKILTCSGDTRFANYQPLFPDTPGIYPVFSTCDKNCLNCTNQHKWNFDQHWINLDRTNPIPDKYKSCQTYLHECQQKETLESVFQSVKDLNTSLTSLIHYVTPSNNTPLTTDVFFGKLHSVFSILIHIGMQFGFSLLVLVERKMEVNKAKYPPKLCKQTNDIQKYTTYSTVTGIKKDSDLKIYKQSDATAPKAGREAYFQFFRHLPLTAEKAHTFAVERGWQDKYNGVSISLALMSELGELTSAMNWIDEETKLNDLTINQRDAILRELADITIYVTHIIHTYGLVDEFAKPVNKIYYYE